MNVGPTKTMYNYYAGKIALRCRKSMQLGIVNIRHCKYVVVLIVGTKSTYDIYSSNDLDDGAHNIMSCRRETSSLK